MHRFSARLLTGVVSVIAATATIGVGAPSGAADGLGAPILCMRHIGRPPHVGGVVVPCPRSIGRIIIDDARSSRHRHVDRSA